MLVTEGLKDKRALGYVRRYAKANFKTMTMADLSRLSFKQLCMGDAKLTRIRINNALVEAGYSPIN